MLPAARIAIAILVVAPGAFARNFEGVLDLDWKVAPGCPDREAAASAIAELVSEPVRGRAAINVEITRTQEGRFAARIEPQGSGQGAQREFEGNDCARVTDAVVLIVAMMLDPVAAAERVKPPVLEERPLGVSIGVRAAADAGSLPAPTAGAGLTLGIHLRRLHGHLEGTAWIPRLALRGPVPGSGGEIGLYSAALRACYDVVRGAGGELAVGPCLGGEVGQSTGRGLNISHPTRSTGLWSAATLAVTARHTARSGFSFWLSAEGGAPFYRPSYFIENYGEVFRAAPVFARLGLTVAWIFP